MFTWNYIAKKTKTWLNARVKCAVKNFYAIKNLKKYSEKNIFHCRSDRGVWPQQFTTNDRRHRLPKNSNCDSASV